MLHTYCRMQLHVPCNLSYATTQICSCMCGMQLNFSCMRQLQNPKFLVVIVLVAKDHKKTTFHGNNKLWEWLVMPFGLKNAHVFFQQVMD